MVIHPRAVEHIKVTGEIVLNDLISNVMGFIAEFLLSAQDYWGRHRS